MSISAFFFLFFGGNLDRRVKDSRKMSRYVQDDRMKSQKRFFGLCFCSVLNKFDSQR